jgi:integrase
MGRRARGDGSVFFDAGRGRWTGLVDLGRDPDTRRRVRRKVTAPTREECRDKLDELREEKRKTGTIARRDVTVGQVLDDWLANSSAQARSPVTRRCHRDAVTRWPEWVKGTRLTRLTPAQVERALAGMVDDGYATSTIKATRSVLVRAIRRAERDGLVVRNVGALVPCPRGTRRESRSMTIEQVNALLSADLTPWWRAYLYAGIMCGLRPGELLGLRWEDVDMTEGVLRVRKAIRVEGRPALQDLKTERSRRTLVMPAAVALMLAALRRDQAAHRLRAGSLYEDHGLVFAQGNGRPCWPVTVRSQFRALCKRAGLGERWHPHEQRHTFVSVLSHAGVDIDQIADAAGHINSNVTKTVYRHQLADKLSAAATVMDATFRASGGAS